MFDKNVLWNKCPIDKTFDSFDSGLGIEFFMSYVMYHKKSDIKRFVSIFVISW